MARVTKTKKQKTLKEKYKEILPNLDELQYRAFKFENGSKQICFHYDLMIQNVYTVLYDGVDDIATVFFDNEKHRDKAIEIAKEKYEVDGYVPNLITF